jgi:hypothetical protein
MYTISNDFYCGIPQELWNNLLMEAEDIFNEEEIGTHILGIYPAGNRIYGCESSSEGLLCLYINTVDTILDPISIKKEYFYNIGLQNSPVWFIELREWIKWLLKDVYGLNKKLKTTSKQDNLFHLIPSLEDDFYKDNSINKIIYHVQELNHFCQESYFIPSPYCSEQKIYDLLSARTRLIWAAHKTYCPNINKKWGDVFNLNNNIDNDFIKMILDNNRDIDIIDKYFKYLYQYTYKTKLKNINKNHFKDEKYHSLKLREEIVKLYRSLC